MRKLLSLFMAAIMLMSLAPLALAREITPASVIDRIEIVGADLKPTTDKLPKDMEMGTMRAGGVSSSVEVSETSYWFDETDQYEADESMPFEARHYYSYCWVFTVKEGYELADSVTVTINGSADNYDVSTSDPRSGFIWCKPILCEADDGIITRVEIKNADITPFAGLTPADMGYGNMYADGSSSIISNTDGWWYCDSTMSNLEEEDTFEVGKRYSYCWLFELNSGYTVSSSTYVTINGSRSNVDEQSSDLEHGIIWCKSVICTEQDIEITVVDITNVTLNPPAGGRAGDYLDFETPFDLPLLTDDVYWFCDNYQTRLESDDMFEEGLFYSMCMIFEPMSGYTFADNLKVRINGSENNVGPEWTTITPAGYLIVWTTSHMCGASSEDKVIDKVELTGVTLTPPAGGRAGDYLDFEVDNELPVLTDDVYWWCETKHTRLSDDSVFEEGFSYSLRISLEPMSGYTFSNETEVYINGSKDNVYDTNLYEGILYISSTTYYCGTPSEPIIVDEVELSDVTIAPPVGGKVYDFRNVTVPDGAHYEVVSAIWCYASDGMELDMNYEFEADKEYCLHIVLFTEYGYNFTEDTKIFINGRDDLYQSSHTNVQPNILNICTVTAESVEAPSVMLGDLNGDGKVNTADAVVVLKISAGMVALDEKYQAAGDCNRDGKVNTADAVLILKYAAGMITEF